MAKGKRSPTAHRTPEQIRKHGRTYQASPEQKKRRAKRNAARRKLEREGKVRKGDGKDVHHKNAKSLSNKRSNLKVASRAKNRGHGKSRGGNKSGRK